MKHRERLIPRLQEVLSLKPRRAWLALLQIAGVPATPVNTLSEVLADPQVAARGAVTNLSHPTIGSLPVISSPLRHASRTPPPGASPPPLLGQHTLDVLVSVLGLNPEEVNVLEQGGVVFCYRE